jgi:dihydroorotate dehydrogenase
VWVKLTPASADIAEEAGASFLGGADAVSSTNTFPALPVVDPQTLEFEVNVDGFVSPGGLGGPAILPQSLAKIAELVQAFPDREFSGVGGISTFDHALSYFLLGCGTVQVATAAMLDHAIGPNVIRGLVQGMSEFLERHADRGWTSLDDFRGRLRDRVVAHSRIARPGDAGYRAGSREAQEAEEGYAPEPVIA